MITAFPYGSVSMCETVLKFLTTFSVFLFKMPLAPDGYALHSSVRSFTNQRIETTYSFSDLIWNDILLQSSNIYEWLSGLSSDHSKLMLVLLSGNSFLLL